MKRLWALWKLPHPQTGESSFYGLVINPSQDDDEVLFLGSEREISEGLQLYQKFIQSQRDISVWGGKCYEMLWAKIDKLLTGVEVLYLSTDDAFALFNPEALPSPESGEVLLKSYSIVDLGDLRGTRPYNELLSLGLTGNRLNAEIFAYSPSNGEEYNLLGSTINANAIPLALEEANVLGMLFEDQSRFEVQRHVSTNCSVDDMYDVESPDLIHVAAHGFFLDDKVERDGNFFGYNSPPIRNAKYTGLLFAQDSKNEKRWRNDCFNAEHVEFIADEIRLH